MSENNSNTNKKIVTESRSLIGSRVEPTSTTSTETPAAARPKKK